MDMTSNHLFGSTDTGNPEGGPSGNATESPDMLSPALAESLGANKNSED